MIAIKLFTVLVAAVSIVKSYLDYRKQRESRFMFVFWTVVWLAVATIIVFPYLIERLIAFSRDNSITLGSVNAFALVFLLFIVYRVYTKVARIEYQQAELIRKLGLSKQRRP